jgi:hypothetical protein
MFMSIAAALSLVAIPSRAPDLQDLAAIVIERGGDASAEAQLRAAGPAGLRALLEEASPLNPRVDAAIDRVAGQRYAHVSRLYWYTDLEAARAESARTGRPILSLRMLGRLTDELSCANSRFFRTALYADPQVAAVMRDRFILHWSSERDVPIITINFGDGRVLQRTVTGNSAHYVLDQHARVIDVIPGLYSPKFFIEQLQAALREPSHVVHLSTAQSLDRRWSRMMTEARVTPSPLPRGLAAASVAVRIAPSKAMVEAPMLPSSVLEALLNEDMWEKLVASAPAVRLSSQSIALIRAENPRLDEAAFRALIDRFSRSIIRDTIQNEYRLHPQIHRFLGENNRPDFATMNNWVYSELFATPAGDPWLGLHDDTIYTGLENAGIRGR